MEIKRLLKAIREWRKERNGEHPTAIVISPKVFFDLEIDDEAPKYIEMNIIDDRIVGYMFCKIPLAITEDVEGYEVLSLEEAKKLASTCY